MTNLEAGKQAPSVTALLDLADALGVSANALLAEAGVGDGPVTPTRDRLAVANEEVSRWTSDLINKGLSSRADRGVSRRTAAGERA